MISCWSESSVTHKSNWIWKYSTKATQLLPSGRYWHFSGTSTTISLPQGLDSSTARINELASSPLSLAIQENSNVGKVWILTKKPLKLQDSLPLCVACQFGTTHQCPWRTKGKKSSAIWKPNQTKPGDGVSVDHIISAQPGLIPQMAGFLTSKQIGDAPHYLIMSAITYMFIS